MVSVRAARPEDVPPLRAIDELAWTAKNTPAPLPCVSEFGTERMPLSQVWVADVDRRVAGYAALGSVSSLDSHAGVGLVRALAVHPDFTRRGIGRALVDRLAALGRERGLRKLMLHALATNTPALALYRAAGFVIEGHFRDEFLIEGELVDDYRLALYLG